MGRRRGCSNRGAYRCFAVLGAMGGVTRGPALLIAARSARPVGRGANRNASHTLNDVPSGQIGVRRIGRPQREDT